MKQTKIIFEFKWANSYFIKKFGFKKALEMVLDYKRTHNCPFIYDMHQLAKILGNSRKDLFNTVRNVSKMYTSVKLKKEKRN